MPPWIYEEPRSSGLCCDTGEVKPTVAGGSTTMASGSVRLESLALVKYAYCMAFATSLLPVSILRSTEWRGASVVSLYAECDFRLISS